MSDMIKEEFEIAVASEAILPKKFCITSGFTARLGYMASNYSGQFYRDKDLQEAWMIWKESRRSLATQLCGWIDTETLVNLKSYGVNNE